MAPTYHDILLSTEKLSLEDDNSTPATESSDRTASISLTKKSQGDEEVVEYDEYGDAYYKFELDFFDIDAFEKECGDKPIFTWAILKEIARKKTWALQQLREHKTFVVYYSAPYNSLTYGKRFVVGDSHHDDNLHICVRYLSRVEMHPGFQKLKKSSPSVELLRELNENEDWLPAPFVFEWILRDQICFGLGRLNFNEDHRELQHLTVFDIAKILDSIYQAEGPIVPKVQVFLQDPMYQAKDKALLQGLHQDVKFVEDPHGFRFIDEHTLVIAAFLPYEFPLMQIIADLFEEGRGPAGIIIDNLERNSQEPGMYRINDRLSPRVVRMMQNYLKYQHGFGGEDLGAELWQELGATKRYWLESMGFWIRRNILPLSKEDNTSRSRP
ncbi:hypothetical protein N0V90_010806 [Kalmusia sp. IMI 367209]|nr:hypothetical protein N0V90_010806 [Kalmusia sp. IMI 367209]